MGWWLLGPAIAIVLALKVSPRWLMILAGLALIAFLFSFGASVALYDECDPCSTRAETHFLLNTVLFTLVPSLFVVSLAKLIATSLSARQA
jgi:hypothetical protein